MVCNIDRVVEQARTLDGLKVRMGNKRTKRQDDARSRIRAVGLRATGSRMATLDVVEAAHAPVSHAEVFDALAHRDLDRATVFHNLTDLADVGLLTRTHIGRTWRFEAVDAHESDHTHFVCNECGDISCLPVVDVRVKAKGVLPRALANNNYTVQFSGRCDDCE